MNQKWREILVDWLIEVCDKFKLSNYTLHLGVEIHDAFQKLQTGFVKRETYQLLGCVCMQLACKLEEVYTLEVKDWVHISAHSFSVQEMVDCENMVVTSLDYRLFLNTLALQYDSYLNAKRNDTKYFLDVVLHSEEILGKYGKEDIIEACIELAEKTETFWSVCMRDIKKFEANFTYATLRKKYGREVESTENICEVI